MNCLSKSLGEAPRSVLCVVTRITIFCVLSFGHFVQPAQADEAAQVNAVLQYFGANCSVNGEWTQDAIKSVNSLLEVFTRIKNDPDCQSVAASIVDLNQSALQLQMLNTLQSETDKQVRSLENQKTELFFLLAASNDASEQEQLRTELRATQVSLSGVRGTQSSEQDNDRLRRRNQSVEHLVSATRSVFNRLSTNQACWVKHSSILGEVAAFGTAVGQSVALDVATGGIATAIGAGVNLVASLIDWVFKSNAEKPIKAMAGTIESTALTCTLETLANQYCGAQDAIDAVAIVARALTSDLPQDRVWNGVKLLERETPNLTSWLEKIRAGSETSGSAVSSQRDLIYKKEQMLKSTLDYGIGKIKDFQIRFNNAPADPADPLARRRRQWAIQREVVLSIHGQIYSSPSTSTSENPMAKIYTDAVGFYVLIGIPSTQVPRDTDGNIRSVGSFDPFSSTDWPSTLPPFNPDLKVVTDSLRAWHQEAYLSFLIEKNSTIFDDPLLIFTSAVPLTINGTHKGLSPRYSIQQILAFLRTAEREHFSSPALKQLFDDTVSRLERVLKIMDDVVANRVPPEDGLRLIDEAANLKNGTDFFRNRIEFFVRLITEDAVLKGAPGDANVNLQLLAAIDVVELLQQYSGRRSLQALVADARNAQAIVTRTLPNFFEVFDESIKNSLESFDRSIINTAENGTGPNRYAKSVMCLNLLSSPRWNPEMGLERCLGYSVSSIFPGGPAPITFTRATYNQPLRRRMCTYRNFLRRNNVYQAFAEAGRLVPMPRSGASPGAPPLGTTPPTDIDRIPATAANSGGLVSPACATASAWRTDRSAYCEADWWDGCDRRYAYFCQATARH